MLSFPKQIIFSPNWSFTPCKQVLFISRVTLTVSFRLDIAFVLHILDFFSFWQQNSLSRPLTVTLCTHLLLGLSSFRSIHVYESQQLKRYSRIKQTGHPCTSFTQHPGAKAGWAMALVCVLSLTWPLLNPLDATGYLQAYLEITKWGNTHKVSYSPGILCLAWCKHRAQIQPLQRLGLQRWRSDNLWMARELIAGGADGKPGLGAGRSPNGNI